MVDKDNNVKASAGSVRNKDVCNEVRDLLLVKSIEWSIQYSTLQLYSSVTFLKAVCQKQKQHSFVQFACRFARN